MVKLWILTFWRPTENPLTEGKVSALPRLINCHVQRLIPVVRERKLDKLRATGYEGTPEEWSAILHYILLPSTSAPAPTGLPDSLRDTLDTTCAISGSAKKPILSVIIRQSVQDISHKFGSLQLAYSDDTDDVDLFGWASEAAQRRDLLAAELRASNTRVEQAEEVIKTLQAQLQDLITAKEEHETQLLSKFAVLLNEKKLKIRSQQHQIANQDAPSISRSAANVQNARKRKRMDDTAPDETSESEGFDAMDVDQDEAETEDESDAGSRIASGEGTEDEAEFPNSPAPIPDKSSSKDPVTVPPPRELPFGIKSKTSDDVSANEVEKKPLSDNEETASEDDEL